MKALGLVFFTIFLDVAVYAQEPVIQIRGAEARELAELLMYQGTIPLEYHGVTIVKTIDGDVLQTENFYCYNKKLSETLTFWGCNFIDKANGKQFLLANYPAWQLFEVLKHAGIPDRQYGRNSNTSVKASFLTCNITKEFCFAQLASK